VNWRALSKYLLSNLGRNCLGSAGVYQNNKQCITEKFRQALKIIMPRRFVLLFDTPQRRDRDGSRLPATRLYASLVAYPITWRMGSKGYCRRYGAK
jgi:hypothetical protein